MAIQIYVGTLKPNFYNFSINHSVDETLGSHSTIVMRLNGQNKNHIILTYINLSVVYEFINRNILNN